MITESTFFLGLIFLFFFVFPAIGYMLDKIALIMLLRTKKFRLRVIFLIGFFLLMLYYEPILMGKTIRAIIDFVLNLLGVETMAANAERTALRTGSHFLL